MVILPESLTEDEIEAGLTRLAEALKAAGGEAAGKPSRMGRKTFARPMKKQTVGEYALLRFSMDGAKVADFLKSLEYEEAVFRIQVTRLPEEATA
jgi:ribosomal protein S6